MSRPARYPAWLQRVFRALRVLARFFCAPVVAILFGVVAPAAWLADVWRVIGKGANVFWPTLFAVAMAFLLVRVLVRPRSPRVATTVTGALLGVTAFAGGLTGVLAPFFLGGLLLPFSYDHIDWEPSDLLNLVPFLGSMTYAANAWDAWSSLERPSRRLLALGAVLPIGFGVLTQGALQLTIHRCVQSMLVEDRDAALAAADACRRMPRAITSWRPMVDAWIAAKGGQPHGPETERSDRIAEVFQRLSGSDLRKGYSSSAPY